MTTAQTTPQEQDPTQRWIAELRQTRFDVRTQLSSGERSLKDVFQASQQTEMRNGVVQESPLWPIKVLWVLESLPGARKVDTRRKLEELGISETQPIGTLTEEQQSILLETFPLSQGKPPSQ